MAASIEERMARKTSKSSGCFMWTGGITSGGYGCIWNGSVMESAHRVAYKLHYGSIPPGTVVMHSCDTPLCVNPEHLSAGTQVDNMKDMASKKRRAVGAACSRFSCADVSRMRGMRFGGSLLREIAAEFHTGTSTVSRICNHTRWV